MKKIVAYNVNEKVPSNAKFLYSDVVPDYKNQYETWRPTPGIMGSLPIFGTETLYRVTPKKTVFYYEVEESNDQAK